MRQKSISLCLVILFLLFFSSSLFTVSADEIQAIAISSARSAAMGGTHAALADDLTTLFNNPAGFRSAGPEFLIAEISLGLSGPIFDIFSAIIGGGSSGSSNMEELLKNAYAALSLMGPVSFGYVGNGLGFGIFNRSNVSFSGVAGNITSNITENLIFAGGYAFRIPVPEKWNSTLDLGILLKSFISACSTAEKDVGSLFDAFDDPLGLINDEPFRLSMGTGVDLGFLYNYKERFSVGLVSRDLFTPCIIHNYSSFKDFKDSKDPTTGSKLLPIDLSIGFLYRPPLRRMERYISDLKLMLDYEDILDFLTHSATSSNPILHIGFGVELILLEILSIRTGFYQGLLSAGLGLDLSVFTLNLAMFGTELSPDPGLRSVFNILIGIEFKL